jgi:TolB protein
MNADGTAMTNVTAASGNDTTPVWSPTGAHVAFISDRDGNAELYVVNADGSSLVRMTNDTGQERDPVWRPVQ